MGLPKEIRDKAGFRPDPKLALVSWMKGGRTLLYRHRESRCPRGARATHVRPSAIERHPEAPGSPRAGLSTTFAQERKGPRANDRHRGRFLADGRYPRPHRKGFDILRSTGLQRTSYSTPSVPDSRCPDRRGGALLSIRPSLCLEATGAEVPYGELGQQASERTMRREHYDVVIVGAGAMGLASAYHLIHRRPELSILVAEARSGPGEGSMGASNGMVRDVFSSRDNRVLAKNAISFYRRLMEDHEELRSPVPLLDLYGYLWLLPERHRTEYLSIIESGGGSIDAEAVDLEGIRSCPGLDVSPSRWFEGDRAAPPEAISGGLFGRTCGALAPEMLARYYCDEARALGVEFAFDACVQRLSFEGREEILLHETSRRPYAFQEHVKDRLRISRVSFGDGRAVDTDTVVVAAGAWAEKLLHPLGVATACSPRPQQLFSLSGPVVEELLGWEPPVHPIDAPNGRPRFPFLIFPTGAVLKPIFRQRQMWLGYVDMVAHPIGTLEDPGRDGRLDYDMARMGDREAFGTDALPAVTPYLPRFETTGVRLERAWGGYYCFSPEGLPVLTEEPYGVIFVGGDSGSAIMKADSIGRLVAAKFEGKRDAELFSGARYGVDRLSLDRRSVEEERIIL